MSPRARLCIALINSGLAVGAAALFAAEADQRKPAPPPQRRVATDARCAAELGSGLTSRRGYCDVLITKSGQDSVYMSIPPHTGTATLFFDLHNRFTVPPSGTPAGEWFMRATALVATVRPTGQILERFAVRGEFRTIKDLFDRIGGGAPPGGLKTVAPGLPESVRATVPAGLNGVGIVGLRLEFSTLSEPKGVAGAPGRPMAIVSNVRVEYTPR